MRNIGALVMSCVPLIVMTARSAATFFGSTDEALTVRKVDLANAQSLSAAALKRVAADSPAANQWLRLDPNDLILEDLFTSDSPLTKNVADGWVRAKDTNAFLAQVAQVDSWTASPNATKERLSDQIATLDGFLKEFSKKAVPPVEGSNRVIAALSHRSGSLKAQLSELDLRHKAEQILKQAEDHLAAAKPEMDKVCLRLVNEEPLKSASDPELRRRINTVRETADFRIAFRRAREDVRSAATPHKKRDILAEFVRTYRRPATQQEQLDYDRVLSARERIDRDVALDELPRSKDFDAMLVRAERVLRNADESSDLATRVRAQVKAWILGRGIPEREPPECLLGRDEAVTNSGRRLIGYFYLPQGVEQWRFWLDAKNRAVNPRGDEQFSSEDLRVQPGKPKYVRLAHEYNQLRLELMRSGASQAEWQSFARRCDELQKELEQYRDRWGYTEEADTACRNWAFADQATLAGQVATQWSRFQAVMGPESAAAVSDRSN